MVLLNLMKEKKQSLLQLMVSLIMPMTRILTLSLLYAEFDDAIREGDGTHIIHFWKFILLLFKTSNRKKRYLVLF